MSLSSRPSTFSLPSLSLSPSCSYSGPHGRCGAVAGPYMIGGFVTQLVRRLPDSDYCTTPLPPSEHAPDAAWKGSRTIAVDLFVASEVIRYGSSKKVIKKKDFRLFCGLGKSAAHQHT
ncbi:hypothetical protein LX32DRAFT_641732 [Colletotrichum zoysiae]|uniref:Uncharacterized protein n=1 Tax=Colletotrichum zoysiae TaxID=1216348 RepID=A0AAD9HEG9_9PEZI|nr:hypothetical protein LX32DRAFT_641732 [Colletotrichum zoysiae]